MALAELFAAAVARHRAGALGDAERLYRQVLARDPAHADSLQNLGLIALQSGNAQGAVELFGRAIAVNDRIAEYHYNIALAFRALGRMDRVEAHLDRAVALKGDYALAHLNLGNVRKEQNRRDDAVAHYRRALATMPNLAVAHVNIANILVEQGQWDEAVASYRAAAALEPNHAETHRCLGAALMRQGKPREAIPHLERALALKPDSAADYDELATAYVHVERPDLAASAASRALALEDTPQRKARLVDFITYARLAADEAGRYRAQLLRALDEGWSRPRELTGVCVGLIRLNPTVAGCIARAVSAWPDRLPAESLFGPSGLAALCQDHLLIRVLECDPIADVGFERFLTNVRQVMLTIATAQHAVDEHHLRFYAAVARQCFINEYVYALPQDEETHARDLQAMLARAMEQGEPIPAIWVVAAAAYVPLHRLPRANDLAGREWPDCVSALLRQQVTEPAEERRLAATIPALTAIDRDVSRAVRGQYEENPYPRWVEAGSPARAIRFQNPQPAGYSPDVLIAGCGTGLSTIEFARQMPHARVLAIDLSLSSLSYAKRMANERHLANIAFGQADLLNLGSLDRQFDFIDASGVLHHLADPWEGWRVLLSLLRPGGTMQVGLYSAQARQNVVAARALIDSRGFRAVAADIRRCREEIMAAETGSVLKSLVASADFYTMSECRDLLFHVEEHRITLPEIKSFIAANKLQFTGFLASGPLLHRFERRFSGRDAKLDLDAWHVFENENPDAFAGMYQFSVCKPVQSAGLTATHQA